MIQPGAEYGRRPSVILGSTEDNECVGSVKFLQGCAVNDLKCSDPKKKQHYENGQDQQTNPPASWSMLFGRVAGHPLLLGLRFIPGQRIGRFRLRRWRPRE